MRRKPKPSPGPARQAPREVLLRGLSVLEALNWRPISSVDQVAAQTGLPKATVVRVLHNLASKGYAQRLPLRKGYMLGERVLNLSSGYDSRNTVVEKARPLIEGFTTRYKWPVSLAIVEFDAHQGQLRRTKSVRDAHRPRPTESACADADLRPRTRLSSVLPG